MPAGQPMPEAMTIASATGDGVPSARLVVLRGLRRGLVFFTDCESDKGAELAANPQAAAVLHWLVPAHRQVRVAGQAERVSQDEADEYWSTRANAVRLGRRRLAAKAASSPAGRSWKRRSGERLRDHPGGAGVSPAAALGRLRGAAVPRRVLAGIAGRSARPDPLPPGEAAAGSSSGFRRNHRWPRELRVTTTAKRSCRLFASRGHAGHPRCRARNIVHGVQPGPGRVCGRRSSRSSP